jgi:hypothetical protein
MKHDLKLSGQNSSTANNLATVFGWCTHTSQHVGRWGILKLAHQSLTRSKPVPEQLLSTHMLHKMTAAQQLPQGAVLCAHDHSHYCCTRTLHS